MECIFNNSVLISDLQQIITIENECYSHPWKFSHFYNELKNNYSLNCKLTTDNLIIGYSFSILLFDELQINNFCVHKNYQNRGFGSQLMEFTLNEAKIKR